MKYAELFVGNLRARQPQVFLLASGAYAVWIKAGRDEESLMDRHNFFVTAIPMHDDDRVPGIQAHYRKRGIRRKVSPKDPVADFEGGAGAEQSQNQLTAALPSAGSGSIEQAH
jgi:hypothetical protein